MLNKYLLGSHEIENYDLGFYLPDIIWVTILSYISNPRQMTRLMRVNRQFNEVLRKNDRIWRLVTLSIQRELNVIKNHYGISYKRYYFQDSQFPNEYKRVGAMGKTCASYYKAVTKYERERANKETRRRIFRPFRKYFGNFMLVVLYYLVLGIFILVLNGTTPAWSVLVPVLAFCVYLVRFIGQGCFYDKSPDIIENILVCSYLAGSCFFLFVLCLIVFSILLFFYYSTGDHEVVMAVFGSICLFLVICYVCSFECVTSNLQRRYGKICRFFILCSLGCYVSGIILAVYAQKLNDSYLNQWAGVLLYFSYGIMALYTTFISHLIKRSSSVSRFAQRCLTGFYEQLVMIPIFISTIMWYYKFNNTTDHSWAVVLSPLFAIPPTVALAMSRYRAIYEIDPEWDDDYIRLLY